MRTVLVDGSPESVGVLIDGLAAALDGGSAVVPVVADPGPLPEPDGAAALIVQTSGSTGEPRRVALSAAALRASANATQLRLGGPGRWLLALPAHHVAGSQVIVRALLAGHPPTVLDTRDGFRPDGFIAAAATLPTNARCYTSLVPTQLHRLLATDDPAALRALAGFDAVLVGGAATPAGLLAAARSAEVTAITTYGMSETAGGCVYDGVPLDGVRLRLTGDRGATTIGGATTGRIELAGPMLADGYLGDPAATREWFVDGWFRTSDLGRLDGYTLTVLGRADDVITTGGESVHPAAVERVLTAQPGVRAACVVGLPDPEWGQLVAAAVVIEADTAAVEIEADTAAVIEGDAADRERWAAAVRSELGSPSVPRRVRVLRELPLRGVGKPDRAAVARLLAEPAARPLD